MAAGKPVLACGTPDTDLGRLVGDSLAGVTVPPGDTKAFVEAVEALLAGTAPEWDRSAALAAAARHSPASCAAAYDRLVGLLTASSASS